jgi:hypothetical protein
MLGGLNESGQSAFQCPTTKWPPPNKKEKSINPLLLLLLLRICFCLKPGIKKRPGGTPTEFIKQASVAGQSKNKKDAINFNLGVKC